VQPAFRLRPIAPNGPRSKPKHLSSLFFRKPCEETTLHNFAESVIEQSQLRQRVVKSEQGVGTLLSHEHVVGETHALRRTPAFVGAIASRMVDENTTHRIRCYSEEMSPICPLSARLVDKLEICFVDQPGSAERVRSVFPAHMTMSHVAEPLVHEREKSVYGRRFAGTPREELGGDIRIVIHSWFSP
jgi:hypothetical protein